MIEDRADRPVVAAAFAHGALAIALVASGHPAAVPVLALAMCWASNTLSHIHLHRPLFRGSASNRAFSLYLTLLLATPQGLWRRRHLRHHQLSAEARPLDALEPAVLLAMLSALAWAAPERLALWAAATALGFGLCAVQGWAEHAAAAAGVDHHGRLYNLLWFNDGYHAAHHRAPQAPWRALPAGAEPRDHVSGWPPILRWLDGANRAQSWLLDRLETLALRWRFLQRLLLQTHEPALRRLLAGTPNIRAITIVGGGLFPRSALLLARLLPRARLTLVDESAAHLARAAAFLPPGPRLVRARFDANFSLSCDLLVIPLGFRGDRAALYARPPAPAVLVHDWLWRRRGSASARVWLLAKRLNLVLSSPGDDTLGVGGPPPEEPAPCYRPMCSSASARATTPPS